MDTRLVGKSVQGRPIILAETADRPEFILMIGRQHPPEVTGAIAMQSFIDTVLGDSDLAHRFRERFKLGIVPVMNPDGVAAGHWRHNVNGVDVNRDWGPFTQPESSSVIRWVQQQESEGRTLQLMLDFHSTFEDLFYTQPVSKIRRILHPSGWAPRPNVCRTFRSSMPPTRSRSSPMPRTTFTRAGAFPR